MSGISVLARMWLWSQKVQGRYVYLSQFFAAYYFAYFLIILPVLSRVETPRPLPVSIADSVLSKAKA